MIEALTGEIESPLRYLPFNPREPSQVIIDDELGDSGAQCKQQRRHYAKAEGGDENCAVLHSRVMLGLFC